MAAGHVVHIDHRLARLKRHIGQLSAVRCPCWRNDGLRTGERRLGVLAIRIRNPQTVVRTGLGDISDTGGENTFLTRELFVDVVGNAVCNQAQIARSDRKTLTTQVLALNNIPQAKAHIPATISQAGHAAGGQRVRTLLAPLSHVGARCFIKCHARGIHAAELAAALQISLNNGGNLLRGRALCLEWGNCNRQLCQAHACYLNPELGQCRNGRCCGQRCQHGSTRSARPCRPGCQGWKSVNSHWQPSKFPEVPGTNTSSNVTHTDGFLM